MIKHLPKMARRHYATAAEGGSKWRAGASTSLAVLAYSRVESVQTRLSQKGGQGTPQSKGQLSWLGLGLRFGFGFGFGLGLGLVSRGLGLGSPASRDRASRPF